VAGRVWPSHCPNSFTSCQVFSIGRPIAPAPAAPGLFVYLLPCRPVLVSDCTCGPSPNPAESNGPPKSRNSINVEHCAGDDGLDQFLKCALGFTCWPARPLISPLEREHAGHHPHPMTGAGAAPTPPVLSGPCCFPQVPRTPGSAMQGC